MEKKTREDYRQNATLLMDAANDKKNTDVLTWTGAREKIPVTDSRFANIKRRIEDGWYNLFAGIGTKNDKSMHTTFFGYDYLSDRLLDDLWIGSGFASRISKAPADDMTREWVLIPGDTEHIILKEMDKLDAQQAFNLALKWRRHYGGSIIAMGIDDGGQLWEPANESRIKKIDWLRTFARTSVSLTNMNFVADPNDPRYGQPEFYTVTPRFSASFNIHYTRVLEFKGLPVTDNKAGGDFWYWGMSELQPIWDQIKDLGAGERNVSKLLYEFTIGKMKIKDLSKLIAENGWEKIKKMIEVINLGKSMTNTLLMDGEDDFTRESVNVSGLPELLDRLMMFLAGVSGIPVTKLFGRSAAGMNATGEGDEKNYYSMIRSHQRTDMIPKVQELADYISVSQDQKSTIEDGAVIAAPLFQETQEQILKNQKIQSEIDIAYMERQVIDSAEVRESRFKNGYSFDTILFDEMPEDDNDDVTVPEDDD